MFRFSEEGGKSQGSFWVFRFKRQLLPKEGNIAEVDLEFELSKDEDFVHEFSAGDLAVLFASAFYTFRLPIQTS